MTGRSCILLAAAVVGAGCAPSQPASAPTPDPSAPVAAGVRRTDPAITEADLRSRLLIFADDSMLGRRIGAQGNVKATDYLAGELRRLGVEPAGENGTYFQTLPFYRAERDTTTTLGVGDTTLVFGQDYIVLPSSDELPYGASADLEGVTTVFGGPMGDPNAITPEQAAGKFVVFGAPASPVDVERMIAEMPEQYEGAAGIAFAFLEFVPQPAREYLMAPQTRLGAETVEGPVGLLISLPTATRLLGTPLGGATVGQGTGVLHGAIRFVDAPSSTPARNVVGVVRGSDPGLAGEYVALGAHSDHIGTSSVVDHDSLRIFNGIVRPQGADDMMKQATAEQMGQVKAALEAQRRRGFPRPDSIDNGADDDGSGSIALLEIAEAYARARTKPRRSMLFVWHTGEEAGLYGSRYFTDNPTVPRDSIVAQINIDMVGRGGADDIAGGGPGYIQAIGSRRLSTELGDLVESVNTSGHHGLTFDYQYDAPGHPQQYYCRSDHYMYARFGIPVAFFSTGAHRDYHMVTDEVQYIDFAKLARVTDFLYDLTHTIADLDHRLVVDQPKPDPNGRCVQ